MANPDTDPTVLVPNPPHVQAHDGDTRRPHAPETVPPPPGTQGSDQAPASRGGGTWEPALSASRAKEYLRCPLQYRLHVVDRIREPATRATALGTLVHSVLEHLYDAPADQRTPEYAQSLVTPRWEEMHANDSSLDALFADASEMQSWMGDVRQVVDRYFQVEDPRWLEPRSREERVDVVSPDGIRLRGFVDRIDCSPAGDLRVVDYKTGKAPSPRYVEEALFQMRFYALLLRESDRLPARTQLLYLKSGQVLTLDPEPSDIDRFQGEVTGIWAGIETDARRGVFAPRRNPLCGWCAMKSLCPVFEGRTPELSESGVRRLLRTRVDAV